MLYLAGAHYPRTRHAERLGEGELGKYLCTAHAAYLVVDSVTNLCLRVLQLRREMSELTVLEAFIESLPIDALPRGGAQPSRPKAGEMRQSKEYSTKTAVASSLLSVRSNRLIYITFTTSGRRIWDRGSGAGKQQRG